MFLVASILQCVCFISNATISYTYYYDKVERKDLTSILNKEELTTEDYKIIYEQTGVTTYGVNRLMKDKEYGIFKLKAIQNAFLEEVEVENRLLGPYCYYQVTNHYMEMVPLKEGDIIISNATQFLGKTFGHAGLATSPSTILESYGYNELSDLGIKEDFTHRASFIVLSPRVDEKIKKKSRSTPKIIFKVFLITYLLVYLELKTRSKALNALISCGMLIIILVMILILMEGKFVYLMIY